MKDKTFHYTNLEMVKYLLSRTPYNGSVLDAGSGKNKVWFNELKGEKYECEIDDGCDYLKDWDKKVDWVVGNPPFAGNEVNEKGRYPNLIPRWVEKSSEIASKGMAFLINHKVVNFLTTARLEKLKDKGFYLTKMIIVSDKRWFGRYYYLIFTKDKNNFIEWNITTF